MMVDVNLSAMDLPWLPEEWARDQRLSYSARGVLAELVATAPGGEMSIERLVTIGAWEDPETIEGYLVELENCGYLTRTAECWWLSDPFTL